MSILRGNRYDFVDDYCEKKGIQLNLAKEIQIYHGEAVHRSVMFCPRATSLIFSDEHFSDYSSLLVTLSYRINPQQLLQLVLDSEQLRFEHLLIFLNHLVNLEILTIPTTILYLASPQSKAHSLHFINTKIKQLILLNLCQFQDIHIVTRFFHCLQSLEIEVTTEGLPTIISYLFHDHYRQSSLTSRTLPRNVDGYSSCMYCKTSRSLMSVAHIPDWRWTCTHHLSSLCCRGVNYRSFSRLQKELLRWNPDAYGSIEYLNTKMFLWW